MALVHGGITRRRAAGVLGVGVAAFAAACGSNDKKESSSAATGTPQSASVNNTVTPPKERKAITFVDGFDPKSYTDSSGGLFAIREGLAEGLVRINFERKFEPALATGIEQIDDTTWRAALRPNVTFHNGSPVNAEAVAFVLNALAGSKSVSAAFKGATVSDAGGGNITIKTAVPAPYIQAILADGTAAILEKSSYGGDATALPVGTGPFRLTSFRPGDRRVMEPNDAYWGGKPAISGVQYLVVPEAQTRANQLKTGSADIMRLVNPPDVPGLKSNTDVTVLTQPLPRVRVLYLNMVKRPTSDIRVRQAIAHAIERQVIVDTVLEGQSAVQTTLFSKDAPWGNPAIKGLPYDPAKAKALLEQAGYTAQSPLSLTLTTYPARAELPGLATVIQDQLKKVGIDCKVQVQDSTVLEPAARRGELDMALIARNPLFLYDPQGIFESDYTTGGSYNLSVYSGLEDRIAAAGTTTDTQKRYQIYRDMEKKIIEDDVNTIALNSYVQIDATRKSITGYRPHPTDAVALTTSIVKA